MVPTAVVSSDYLFLWRFLGREETCTRAVVEPFCISAASMPSSLIPNHFISCSQNESLNFAVFNQKIHYSRDMPSFMIKISQAAHISFFL